jgi:hypothetical protein
MNTVMKDIFSIENDVNDCPCFAQSETELSSFLEQWRAGTLPKSDWTHAAHVAVAACHLFDYSANEALRQIRAGIIRYNTCVGTANTDHSGYHETLTRFWCGLIADFLRTRRFSSRLESVRGALRRFAHDSTLFRGYYSFDVVNDAQARREWIAPDLHPQARP